MLHLVSAPWAIFEETGICSCCRATFSEFLAQAINRKIQGENNPCLSTGLVLHCAVVWLWRVSLGNTVILASAADHLYFSAVEHVFLSWISSFPAGKLSLEFYYHSLTLGLSVSDSIARINFPANEMNSWT